LQLPVERELDNVDMAYLLQVPELQKVSIVIAEAYQPDMPARLPSKGQFSSVETLDIFVNPTLANGQLAAVLSTMVRLRALRISYSDVPKPEPEINVTQLLSGLTSSHNTLERLRIDARVTAGDNPALTQSFDSLRSFTISASWLLDGDVDIFTRLLCFPVGVRCNGS
jgi:hypothetical protein